MNLQTLTVLIVEDLATDRELYRRALRQDSSCVYDLLEVESVAAGLALCQTRSIDAVLLDYRLPDGNGLDFLEQLSVQSNGSSPPVVMISGQGNEKIAVRAIKLGAEDYVTQPHVKRVRYDVGFLAARLRVCRISFVVLSSIVPTTERFPLRRFTLGKMSNPSLFKLIAALISRSTIREFCSSQ